MARLYSINQVYENGQGQAPNKHILSSLLVSPQPHLAGMAWWQDIRPENHWL